MKTSLRLSRIALLLLFLIFSLSAFSQLTGTYTIDPLQPASATNYLNFTDAVNDLNTQGISSSVFFVVSPGIYNESVVINEISGASNINRIEFYSSTLDPTDVY